MPTRVRQVITLGSPFGDVARPTSLSRWFELASGRDLSSEMPEQVERIRAAPPVPSTAIYSKSDGITHWRVCRETDGPGRDNIEVSGSHCGLGWNPLVLWAIADRLAQKEDEWAPFDRKGWRAFVYGWKFPPRGYARRVCSGREGGGSKGGAARRAGAGAGRARRRAEARAGPLARAGGAAARARAHGTGGLRRRAAARGLRARRGAAPERTEAGAHHRAHARSERASGAAQAFARARASAARPPAAGDRHAARARRRQARARRRWGRRRHGRRRDGAAAVPEPARAVPARRSRRGARAHARRARRERPPPPALRAALGRAA